MSIFLVRHGETNSNRDKIIQTPDTPLSTLGHKQALALAVSFAEVPIANILCSDYVRTRQTAAPLHTSKSCDIAFYPQLRERNFGNLRGKPYAAIEHDIFADNYAPPGGETVAQFAERISDFWHLISNEANDPERNILVMTHGLVLRELVSQHLITPQNISLISNFENTSVTEVDATDKKTIIRLCDNRHLKKASSCGGIV